MKTIKSFGEITNEARTDASFGRPKHKYKVKDQVSFQMGNDTASGVIQDVGYSIIDNKQIPSYWIKSEYWSDGYARNVWETSIKG